MAYSHSITTTYVTDLFTFRRRNRPNDGRWPRDANKIRPERLTVAGYRTGEFNHLFNRPSTMGARAWTRLFIRQIADL